jgi:hypothetical protein
MGPTRRQLDMSGGGELLKPGVPVDLNSAPEFSQVSCRTLSPPIGAVEIDYRRQVFKAELQLVIIEPFCPPTKLAALQLLHDQS